MAQNWLMKQALWQVYLPAPRYIPRPKFDVPVPNKVHQADLLYLPHDRPPRSRKTFKYALTVVDVASRYKEVEPLTTQEAKEVAAALERIYSRGPLKWPKLLQVDPGREFMGAVNQLLSKHNVEVRRGRVDIHRDQAIVERFNRTLAERLFGHQYGVEMRLPDDKRSTEWVARLPAVISALNKEVTRLTGQKPVDAIKKKTVPSKHSTPYLRPVGVNEKKLPSGLSVRYLYQPGELEGGRRRATDPIWSLNVYEIEKIIIKPDTPVIYYLFDGPKRWFVREELLVVPPDTQLPHSNLTMKLDRFCVNTVFQYPAFVVVSAQPQLLLFVSNHLPVPHPKTSISCYVLAAFQSFLKTLPHDLVLFLRHPFRAELLFFTLRFVNVIAF